MSMLTECISDINEGLSLLMMRDSQARPVRYDAMQLGGIAKTVYDQKEGSYGLVVPGEDNRRVVCETDRYDVQVVHLLSGMDVTGTVPYGSLYQHEGELALTMLACAKGDMNELPSLMFYALQRTPGVRIDGVNLDSFAVLTQLFRFQMNARQNIDPLVFGAAVRYRIGRVDSADLLTSL